LAFQAFLVVPGIVPDRAELRLLAAIAIRICHDFREFFRNRFVRRSHLLSPLSFCPSTRGLIEPPLAEGQKSEGRWGSSRGDQRRRRPRFVTADAIGATKGRLVQRVEQGAPQPQRTKRDRNGERKWIRRTKRLRLPHSPAFHHG